jgi:cytochrome c5
MSEEQDKAFFRNYAIVIGILTVLIVVFLVLARLVVPHDETISARDSANATENTTPVGKVRLTGETLTQEAIKEEVAEPEMARETVDPGKQVYGSLCFSCHGTGLPGIPQLGDKAAWADRIAQGKDVLYDRAISGFTGASGIPMPPKGGNVALSDDVVIAAVDYMVVNAE